MMLTQMDQRVLGAIRVIDGVTGLPIRTPLSVQAADLTLLQNRSGCFVIVAAPGLSALQAHTTAFHQPPATPLPNSIPVVLAITHPIGHYLPRTYTLTLPRQFNVSQNHHSQPVVTQESIFQPIDVPLYRSPIAPTAPNWAVLRATVIDQANQQRLPWALIRVTRQDSATVVRSLADWRGEALIVVPGIPIMTASSGAGAVLANDVEVTLDITVDSTLHTIPYTTDLSIQTDPNQGYLPNPDDLENRLANVQVGRLTDRLVSGRDRSRLLAVSLAPKENPIV